MSEGVQIVYNPNVLPVTPASLTFPAVYTPDGTIQTKRLPNCSLPIKYGVKTNNLVVEFESGHEQRRQKGMMRRTFDIEYKGLTAAQAKVIEAFFFTCRGSVRAFNWTDPSDKTTYIVRFENDNFAKEYFAHSIQGPIYKIVFKLIQVV